MLSTVFIASLPLELAKKVQLLLRQLLLTRTLRRGIAGDAGRGGGGGGASATAPTPAPAAADPVPRALTISLARLSPPTPLSLSLSAPVVALAGASAPTDDTAFTCLAWLTVSQAARQDSAGASARLALREARLAGLEVGHRGT